MQIVIPMAGRGKRFTTKGYSTPKPLIKVDTKPMIEHVTRLFSPSDSFLYICNSFDLKRTNMRSELQRIQPQATIVGVSFSGKGPVYDVMQAKEYIHDDSPVIVNYCDFNMGWNYKSFKSFVSNNDLDGCIVCYKGFHPHLLGPNLYASVKTDKENNFLEIREKYSFTPNKMDCWQSCGTYYFKNGKIVKEFFEKTITNNININGEYYVSLVYNLMNSEGLKIKVFPIEYFCQWGTPEDLEAYTYWSDIMKHL